MQATLKRGARMAVMSVVSFVLNLGIFASITRVMFWPAEVAALIAISILTLLNFGACRYWIFDARSGDTSRQFLGFSLATIGFRLTELTIFSVVYRLTHVNEVVVYGVVLAVSFMAKLLFFETKVFRVES